MKSNTWKVERSKHQQKVEHLTKKWRKCGPKHRACKEIQEVWMTKVKGKERGRAKTPLSSPGRPECARVPSEGREDRGTGQERGRAETPLSCPGPTRETIDAKDTSGEEEDGGTEQERGRAKMPLSCPGPAGMSSDVKDPSKRLSTKYMSRPEDKEMIDSERKWIMWKADKNNMKMEVPETNVEVTDNEVVTFGNIVLTEDERSLLNLGPGFMVASKLDIQEMQVEAAVTMTKIRWSRRKEGVEDLTQEQQDVMEEDMDMENQEDMDIAEAIEAEARDVVSSDGRSVNMGRKRPTDQHNNREVRMPGPAASMVEAENNTRVGVWITAFKEHKENHCKEDGGQKVVNLMRSQELGLKSIARKVARLEMIVVEADKGKKFVVMDEATYIKKNGTRPHLQR